MRQGLSNENKLALIALLFSGGAWIQAGAQNGDAPDVRKENRFYQIYRQYSATPTSPEKWNEALSRAKTQTYIIQKGDTLWDVSQTFFADPNFWPKIWSLNSGIYNPHEISPSGVVQFSPGTTSEPPRLGAGPHAGAPSSQETPVAAAQAGPAETPAQAAVPKIGEMVEIDLATIKLPPPSKSAKAATRLPPSVPSYSYVQNPEVVAKLELTPARNKIPEAPLILTHFASDTKPSSLGEVVGTELGFSSAGEGQEIIIKGNGFSPGQRVLAVRSLGSLPDNSGIGTYGIQGELEIRAAVNSGESLYRAAVVKSLSLVEAGDQLVAEPLMQVQPQAGGTMSPIPGKIIGGQYSAKRDIFGPYSVVYLNVGAGQGVNVGTHVPVYRNAKTRNSKSLILENPAEIGELQIVRVGDGVSTAIVLRQLDDIRVGDTTSPQVQ